MFQREQLFHHSMHIIQLNNWLMEEFPGEKKIHKSIDTTVTDDQVIIYPVEFLNPLELTGMPPLTLKLKAESQVII